MPLVCTIECHDDAEFFYMPPDDYGVYPFKRGRKCPSCQQIIKHNEICTITPCWRCQYDAEVYTASLYVCEACSDLYFSFTEMGFELSPAENMKELLEEYHYLKANGELPDCMRNKQHGVSK